MQLVSADVVGFTGLESVDNISKGPNGIAKKRGGPVMASIHGPRYCVKSTVKKTTVYGPVRAIVLTGAVSVEQPDNNTFCAFLQSRIFQLHLTYPFGNRVV